MEYTKFFEEIHMNSLPEVGGKNASLGEMYNELKSDGIAIPRGFATTAKAYFDFLEQNGLKEKIGEKIEEFRSKKSSLEKIGREIREMILEGTFSDDFQRAISDSYQQLKKECKKKILDVAVRSSATAEDLPDASFAGQQETYLNVRGENHVLESCRKCFSSLFTDRAITYREVKGFDHLQVALSVSVQQMVRSDKGGSGVLFTIDTETGFPHVVVINAAWGLGENVVQGTVNPDEYIVFKPLLQDSSLIPIIEKNLGEKEMMMIYDKKVGTKNRKTPKNKREQFVLDDREILQLARWAMTIEKHYGKPMDIEWAKDGQDQQLYIVQARPETVQSRKELDFLETYTLTENGKEICSGLAIGDAIATGKAQVIKSIKEIGKFEKDSILITEMTNPDWVPIMKMAKGIITNHGGRTSHAAIMSRELGVPAIVGTNNATEEIPDKEEITLSCAEGDHGFVYEGTLQFEKKKTHLDELPTIHTDLLLNIASPSAAFRWWKLPCKGIGLARMEFIVENWIQIHPMALIHFDNLKNKQAKRQIARLTKSYPKKEEFFIDRLARGISMIAASRYPDPVILRMSDFKTNEYANLIGGKQFEKEEENPMIGFRGASRYYHPRYREGFGLECKAVKKARDEFGLKNLIVMIPFCRTPEEAHHVFEVMREEGLERGKNGLEIYVMAEIPSNIILAEEFSRLFDGFSIGSNDLTQLILGVDRDSEDLAHVFDERHPAVKKAIKELIETAHRAGCKVGICGQGPSDHVDFAQFLIGLGIDSLSLNPDSILTVIKHIAEIEKNVQRSA